MARIEDRWGIQTSTQHIEGTDEEKLPPHRRRPKTWTFNLHLGKRFQTVNQRIKVYISGNLTILTKLASVNES